MKKAIHITASGDEGFNYIITGTSPKTILTKLGKYQDLHCLYSMGSVYEESDEGKDSITRLGEFLKRSMAKDFSLKDYLMLDLRLSLGDIKVLGVMENEEELKAYAASHPECEIR